MMAEEYIIMRTLGTEGDTECRWNPKDPDEVREARKMFDKMVKEKNHTAWRVTKRGKKDKEITKFDRTAGIILFVPPMRGGSN